MSTEVDLSELADRVADYRFAYLMTVGDEGRVHAVAVTPTVQDATLLIAGPGRRTLANAQARPDVSMVWPPAEIDGYSLIVDGAAGTHPAGLALTPTRAVLHRSAPSPNAGSGCGSDCVEL